MGAEILRLVLAYERLIQKGTSRTEAAHVLTRQNRNFSPEFFEALVTLDPNAEEGEIRRCRIEEFVPGMIIQQEVRTHDGGLLVSKGHEVTPTVIFKLKNFHARRAILGDVTVSMRIRTSASLLETRAPPSPAPWTSSGSLPTPLHLRSGPCSDSAAG